MKNAFKTQAKATMADFHKDTALRLIRPTLLKQAVVSSTFHQIPPALREHTSIYLGSSYNYVQITVHMTNLDSFKDPRLLRVLEKFAAWKAETSDWTGSGSPNRDYSFTHRFHWDHDKRSIAYKKLAKMQAVPETFEIYVKISAWVKEDSATCRIITKTHEEVIKKEERIIVCD